MTGVRRMPSDVARCQGRTESHPNKMECVDCMRRMSPPHDRQVWIQPTELSPCDYKLEMEQ